jgi:DNA-binding Lrp family transcriptional regulator
MTRALDEIDRKLLNLIQSEFPLEERPFAAIGRKLELSEPLVLARIAALRNEPKVIRQISAIFDSKSLGYQGMLVAARVEESLIDDAAAVINAHPGVSHNYRRNHAYNLWYTLAVHPGSRLGLAGTVHVLHRLSGALITRPMPTLKTYKIGVKLNLSDDADAVAHATKPAKHPHAEDRHLPQLTERDKRMIRALQQDLALVERPFDALAKEAGVTVAELLAAARSYEQTGRMRRFAAVLRHREAGFKANAMGAWIVPAEKEDDFGAAAARFQAVSHCYRRPTYEDWPYGMFTMVHGQTEADCESVLKAISDATGVTGYAALYSTNEYKKTRVRYFTGEIEAWEHRFVGAAPREPALA